MVRNQRLVLFLLAGFLMFSTGCIEIIEELILKKKGTGTFTIKIDMSAFLGLEGLTDAFNEGLEKEKNEEEIEDKEEDNLFFNIGKEEEKDSIFYYKNLPDAKKLVIDRPDIFDKVYSRMSVSKPQKKAYIAFSIDFDKIEEVNYFSENFRTIVLANLEKGEMEEDSMEQVLTGILPIYGGPIFSLENKLLKRLPTTIDLNAIATYANSDNKSFLNSMFNSSSYEAIYHLPKKIKSATNPNSFLANKKKTIELKVNLSDLIRGEANIENEIKYK